MWDDDDNIIISFDPGSVVTEPHTVIGRDDTTVTRTDCTIVNNIIIIFFTTVVLHHRAKRSTKRVTADSETNSGVTLGTGSTVVAVVALSHSLTLSLAHTLLPVRCAVLMETGARRHYRRGRQSRPLLYVRPPPVPSAPRRLVCTPPSPSARRTARPRSAQPVRTPLPARFI